MAETMEAAAATQIVEGGGRQLVDYALQPGMYPAVCRAEGETAPLISIITPYYNAGAYFTQTFQCVCNQTFPWFEWIVVDDGSTDEASLDLLQKAEKQDARLRVYHKQNGGAATARNAAIAHAQSELLFPLDADDLIEPTYLEYLYWALYFHPEAGWAYADSVGFQEIEYVWEPKFSALEMKHHNLLSCTAAIRRTAFAQVGNYSEITRYFNEDWHAWLKLLSQRQYPVQITGEYLFWYRRHSGGSFSWLNGHTAANEQDKRLIEEAGEKIREDFGAVQYPPLRHTESVECTFFSWPLRKKKLKPHTALLFLEPPSGGDALEQCVGWLKALEKSDVSLVVVSLSLWKNEAAQRIRHEVPAFYQLERFLSRQHEAEFLCYLVQSCGVDIVFAECAASSSCFLLWLKECFPALTTAIEPSGAANSLADVAISKQEFAENPVLTGRTGAQSFSRQAVARALPEQALRQVDALRSAQAACDAATLELAQIKGTRAFRVSNRLCVLLKNSVVYKAARKMKRRIQRLIGSTKK